MKIRGEKWEETHTKNYSETFYSAHVRGFEITLQARIKFWAESITSQLNGDREFKTYGANKPLILHLVNGNIVDESRNDDSRVSLFAKVNLL